MVRQYNRHTCVTYCLPISHTKLGRCTSCLVWCTTPSSQWGNCATTNVALHSLRIKWQSPEIEKNVMYGSRDPKSRLWRVDLKQKIAPNISQCNHAHDNTNQKYLINYLYAACFSPVKSTWNKAIKNGNFSS
jgi:hypothetical protein